jgi:DUF1680 family protein
MHCCRKDTIILYMATGERKYLDAARNGYRKLEKWHLLANGCNSSEEGLSEKTSLSGYEMCDVSDFTWATAYMLKATGEVEWADKIERNILNAGLGAVTKEFDAHTYLSTMNQVVSALGSGQSPIMNPNSQAGVMAYCQRHMPFCCTGNATRFFPIYVGLQWLKGRDGALVKALYGPGSCVHEVAEKKVTIREESSFPFSETITLKVVEGGASFPLLVRIPTWAKGPSVSVNGVARSGVQSGTFLTLEGEHKAGDVITLTFPREVQVRPWEMNGVVVEYGPLLFSLAIPAKVERVLLNELQWHATPADSKSLYGYNMVPDGKWNYVLALDKARNHRAEVVENPAADLENPWNPTNSPLAIRMYGLEMPSWTLRYQQYKPFREKEIRYAPLTPPLPPRGCMTMVTVSDFCGKPEKISLVPYGSTTLRLTVFPYWDVRDIPSFRENQLKYR